MAAKSKARARAATRKQSKPGKTKAKTSEEIGGMLFVGSIIVFGVIGTQVFQRTQRALRAAGLANFAAQADDIQVSGVVSFGWEKCFHVVMGLVGVHLIRPKPQAAGDAVDMSVDREGRHVQ